MKKKVTSRSVRYVTFEVSLTRSLTQGGLSVAYPTVSSQIKDLFREINILELSLVHGPFDRTLLLVVLVVGRNHGFGR
jgi:hypothetical protein